MSREIVLNRASGAGALPPGYYAVTVDRTTSDRLYCDGTNAATPPTVDTNMLDPFGQPSTQYNFVLFSDCDDDGVWDTTEIATSRRSTRTPTATSTRA